MIIQDGSFPAFVPRGPRVLPARFSLGRKVSDRPATFEGPEIRGRLALSTHLDRDGERVDGGIRLRADEGVIVEQG